MVSNALAQQGLLHFAGGCARKVVDLVDLLGPSLPGAPRRVSDTNVGDVG